MNDRIERATPAAAQYVDVRLKELANSATSGNEAQLMVLTALTLADEIFDQKAELTLSVLKTRVAGLKPKIKIAREQTNGMVKAHNTGKKGAELLDFPEGLK